MDKTALQTTYVKQRRQLGRPITLFLTKGTAVDLPPVKSEKKHFLAKWTVDKATEQRTQFAVATVNTENVEYTSRGMCHLEGGYAKEIDIEDEEQTLRYKKKLQRSEEYRIEMTRNLESMKKAVMQNAGVNIYENYFESCADGANVLQCYRHPNSNIACPATKVSISIEQSPKIAVAYSHSIHDLEGENVIRPLVWDMTQNDCFELNCESSCCTLSYHKKFSNVIAGGLQNGKVCLWDTRSPTEPCIIANKAHNGYVSCLRWSHKCNFEMLSGSSNGEAFWWDIRKMDVSPCQFQIESIETNRKVTAGAASDNSSIGSSDIHPLNQNACTAFDFDKVNSKYIRIGTGDGRVIVAHKNNNRMEKLYDIQGHEGSVSTITQNWASYKCVLSVDSGDIKVWNEDMKSSPMFTVSSIENEYTCGAWSLTRYSRFFIGKVDGSIQFWDLTFNHDEPYFTLKPSCHRLNDIQTNNYGTLMASCCSNGDVYVIELTDNVCGTVREFAIEEMDFGNIENY